jgi:3-oxoadipate enol-lactonase
MSPFFRNSRNIKLFYQVLSEEKAGPTIIFLHGYGSSYSIFSEQIKLLKEYFKIVLFDAEGHGSSEKGESEIQDNFTDMILRDLEILLDELTITGDLGIIGHSMLGCGSALKFAMKYPTRMKFLILLNGSTLIMDSTIRNIFWNLLPQFTRMNFHEILKSAPDILVERTSQFIHAALIAQFAAEHPTNEIDTAEIDQQIQTDLHDMFENELDPSGISCPTLIIGAELDNFAPAYMSKMLRKKIPNSELYIITMTGHFGTSQRGGEYNKIIKEFLKRNKLIE